MTEYYLLTEDDKEKIKAGCVYEIWDAELKIMRSCNREPYGKRGKTYQQPLCEEHFNFANGLIK